MDSLTLPIIILVILIALIALAVWDVRRTKHGTLKAFESFDYSLEQTTYTPRQHAKAVDKIITSDAVPGKGDKLEAIGVTVDLVNARNGIAAFLRNPVFAEKERVSVIQESHDKWTLELEQIDETLAFVETLKKMNSVHDDGNSSS